MTPKTRGFTLLEVLVTLAILFIVLGALFGVVQGQQAAFYQGNMQRAAQGSVRAALSYVEQKVATAGYGMDPALAFDFTSAVAPCPALAAPCARDRTDGNDELVFYARNPRYYAPESYGADPVGNAWRIASVVGDTLTIVARGGEVFPKGRILQAVCQNASNYAYFTVDTGASTDTANATFPITLSTAVASNPFLRQDLATDPCFSNGTARLFLIDRFRFHVRPVTIDNQVTPYLVLDAGLDANGDGWDENEEIIVAEGIESFQVAYDLTNPNLATRGSVPGTPITFTAGFPGTTSASGITTLAFPGAPVAGQTAYQWTSWYNYPATAPLPAQRNTDHQANIRSVRVSLVGRGPAPNATGSGSGSLLPLLNQDVLPGWVNMNASYNRTRVDATIPVRNMTNRGLLDS